MKVLVAGSYEVVPEHLVHRMKRNEFTVERASTFEDVVQLVSDFEQSLIIVGFDSDNENISLVRLIRRELKLDTPVLVLTKKVEHEALLQAFESGCDDYQQSDCDAQVIQARVNALIRRSGGQCSDIIEVGDITLDLTRHVVTVRNKEVSIRGL